MFTSPCKKAGSDAYQLRTDWRSYFVTDANPAEPDAAQFALLMWCSPGFWTAQAANFSRYS